MYDGTGCAIRNTLDMQTAYQIRKYNYFISLGSKWFRFRSEVERSLMVRWVVGSILHRVDPLSYFLFQPVLHDWCIKGRGMCYPVCGMVHIKEPLLSIDKIRVAYVATAGFLSHYQNGP